MSYILDALKKAEKQRELGQVPSIGSVHEAGSHSPNRRWRWVLVSVLILNAVIIGILFWPAQDREDKPLPPDSVASDPVERRAAGSPASGSQPAPVSAGRSATASEGDTSTSPPIGDARSLAPSSENAASETRPLKPLPAGSVTGSPEPARAQAPEAATGSGVEASSAQPVAGGPSLPPLPEIASAEARPLKPLPLAQDPPRASPGTGKEPTAPGLSSRDPPSPAPKHEKLPVWPLVEDDLFRRINADLKVNVHVYSKNPEGRFVFLNMKIYREGDELLEGPQLERITQDGVILSFRGERFRVPAR